MWGAELFSHRCHRFTRMWVRNYSPTDVTDLHGCRVRNYSSTDGAEKSDKSVIKEKICENPWNLWENILKQKGCVIILPRMSRIYTDVGACERTRIARITRMQHKKKSVKIREICGTTFLSKIRGNPWNLREYIIINFNFLFFLWMNLRYVVTQRRSWLFSIFRMPVRTRLSIG